MFLDFFYALRLHRVPVTTHNWLALMQALAAGLHRDSLDGFFRCRFNCFLCWFAFLSER